MLRRLYTFGLLLALAAAVPVPVRGQDCWDDVLCIDVMQVGQVVHFYVDNLLPGNLTVELNVELENLAADVDFPYVATYRGPGRSKAFTLHVDDPYRAWRYRYQFRWMQGSIEARHDDTFVYGLPYAPGTAHPVLQGFDGFFSHRGKHAIDWGMPEGTPVHAAREGRVIAVCDTNTAGGLEERFRETANYILIQHPDGTVGAYMHLRPGGAGVQVGQEVYQGQQIGFSGNTGYSSGAHLHFEVTRLTPDFRKQTIPVRFVVGEDLAAFLRAGATYRAVLRP